MHTMEQYLFSSSQCKVFWFHTSLKVQSKNTLSNRKVQPIILVETGTSCEIFKQNASQAIGVQKAFAKFHINVNSGVHLHKSCKSCRSQVFNFTKDKLCLIVLPGIWKMFRTVNSQTPAASYFHYYLMSVFFLGARVFNLYLFRWQHKEIISDPFFNNISSGSSISNFLCNRKLHLLELGLYIYTCHLYTRTSVYQVSYLLASSIQQVLCIVLAFSTLKYFL